MYRISDAVTSGMIPGQYFVIVQHPMQNDTFDVIQQGDYVVGASPVRWTNLFRLTGEGSLQGSEAAMHWPLLWTTRPSMIPTAGSSFRSARSLQHSPQGFYEMIKIDGKPGPAKTMFERPLREGR